MRKRKGMRKRRMRNGRIRIKRMISMTFVIMTSSKAF